MEEVHAVYGRKKRRRVRGRDVKDEDEEYCEILVSQDKIQSSDSLRPNNYVSQKIQGPHPTLHV